MPRSPLAFAFVAALPLAAQAPAPSAPEAILPTSTYAVFRFGGLAACRGAANDLPLGELIGGFLHRVAPAVRQEHLDQGLDQAALVVREQLARLHVRAADVRSVLGLPMALAVGRLSIEGYGPSLLLVLDDGAQRPAVDRVVQAMAQRLERLSGGGEAGTVEIDGSRFHTLQLADGPTLFAGAVGRFYVVTNSRGYLREALAVQAGRQPALGSGGRLEALVRELPAPALASVLVNAATVVGSLAPHLPYESSEWADALGLGALEACYWATTADARGGADLLHVGIGGSEHGLCKALLAGAADLDWARACSPNTVLFAAGRCDILGVVDAFERFAALLPFGMRRGLVEDLRRDLGREFRGLGTTPDEVHRVLGAFGPQVGLALALEKGAVPKPELLLRLSVREAPVVRDLLRALERRLAAAGGVAWKARDVDGQEVRFCNLQLPELPFQLSPCYALTNDALWLGSDAQALVRALRQDPAAGLAAQADFQQLLADSRGASGVLHCRLFRAAEIGWRAVETLVYPQLDAWQEQIGFGSDALPDAEAMAKALGASSCHWHVGRDGVTVHSRGTLAFGGLLAALGLVADDVLARAGRRAF
jgi:hypothetical protein